MISAPMRKRGEGGRRSSRRGAARRALSEGSVRHYLNALGNVFARAVSDGALRSGNPVHQLMAEDKPRGEVGKGKYLEPAEAALLLESARLHKPGPDALFTVAREIGHQSTTMIEQRYGHLIEDRSKARNEVVERGRNMASTRT